MKAVKVLVPALCIAVIIGGLSSCNSVVGGTANTFKEHSASMEEIYKDGVGNHTESNNTQSSVVKVQSSSEDNRPENKLEMDNEYIYKELNPVCRYDSKIKMTYYTPVCECRYIKEGYILKYSREISIVMCYLGEDRERSLKDSLVWLLYGKVGSINEISRENVDIKGIEFDKIEFICTELMIDGSSDAERIYAYMSENEYGRFIMYEIDGNVTEGIHEFAGKVLTGIINTMTIDKSHMNHGIVYDTYDKNEDTTMSMNGYKTRSSFVVPYSYDNSDSGVMFDVPNVLKNPICVGGNYAFTTIGYISNYIIVSECNSGVVKTNEDVYYKCIGCVQSSIYELLELDIGSSLENSTIGSNIIMSNDSISIDGKEMLKVHSKVTVSGMEFICISYAYVTEAGNTIMITCVLDSKYDDKPDESISVKQVGCMLRTLRDRM